MRREFLIGGAAFALAVLSANAVGEHYKRVASEFKGNKKDAPAPEPEASAS